MSQTLKAEGVVGNCHLPNPCSEKLPKGNLILLQWNTTFSKVADTENGTPLDVFYFDFFEIFQSSYFVKRLGKAATVNANSSISLMRILRQDS